MTDLATVGRGIRRRLTVRGASEDLLMVEWLGELLYAFEVRRELFRSAKVEVREAQDGLELSAELEGELFDADRHPVKFVVKAVTYHGLTVGRRAERWFARVLFDI